MSAHTGGCVIVRLGIKLLPLGKCKINSIPFSEMCLHICDVQLIARHATFMIWVVRALQKIYFVVELFLSIHI